MHMCTQVLEINLDNKSPFIWILYNIYYSKKKYYTIFSIENPHKKTHMCYTSFIYYVLVYPWILIYNFFFKLKKKNQSFIFYLHEKIYTSLANLKYICELWYFN